MIKKIGIAIICLFSISGFACTKSVPPNNPKFCTSFKKAAICYCTESGLPAESCQDMHGLYDRMTSIFGSLEKACEYQPFTSKQDCIDGWRCYMFGGTDSAGRACSSTGLACE